MKKIICIFLCSLIISALSLSVSAMPEQQGEYEPKNTDNANISISNKSMNIDSKNKESVLIECESFNVNKDETVIFDNKNKTNSYIILIHDDAPSVINGTVFGGNNIYIINPNGVIFGSDSRFDVGNLYVSTCMLNQFNLNDFQQETNPFSGNSETLKGDVIGLGTVKADSVYIEGQSVYFSNSAFEQIPAQKIKVISQNSDPESDEASILSAGYPWIVLTIVSVAVATVVSIVIIKKKTAPNCTGKKEN